MNSNLRQPILNIVDPKDQGKHWFKIKNGSKGTVQITINDEIGGWGISARYLVDQISALDPTSRINLHIYSPGGDVLDGNQIYNALKSHPGGVDVTIGALCASIATVIACAGKTVTMAKNGLFMIHNPWTYARGEADDLRRMATVMDKMKDNIVVAYEGRTKLSKEDLAELMNEETWLTAEEAIAKGFVDSVVPDLDGEDDPSNRFDLSGFKNSAQAISRLPKRKGGNETPPAPSGNAKKPDGNLENQTQKPTLTELYMTNKLRVFNSILFGSIAMMMEKDNGGGSGGSETPPNQEAVVAEATRLYKAKLKRDSEIDEIVLAVRKRDKKDFGALAAKYKQDDKTPDEFARALTTDDSFKPHEVVGSGIEVIGVQGLEAGTPGEIFVASDMYKALSDRIRKGSHAAANVMVETRGFIADAMARFLNVTTSSGLTSIEKLPGIVTLGVRPLMVKDLIAPGATNNTTIRYIQESSFTNAAATTAEGSAKPAASFALAEVDAVVKKIAVYTKVTDELFADFLAVASYINMRLPYMVERTEEDEILNGTGLTTHITGIMATSGIQTQALGALTRPDAIYKAFTKIRWGNLAGTALGGFEPDGIILHPTDWEAIRLLKDTAGQYLAGGPFTGAYGNGALVQFDTLWGKPVVVTPAQTLGTALVGAFRLAAQYFQRQGLTIESTNTDQDDFIKNLTTIRAESRLALAVYRPPAFCTVTGL